MLCFLSHKWALDKPLALVATTCLPLELENTTVEEMWDVHHGWKGDEFADLLTQNTVKIIASHSLFSGEDNEDHLIWSGSSLGKLTIKPVLTTIREDIQEDSDTIWRLIWQLRASQRVCFFIWLAAHDQIMTNANRYSHGLASNPFCKLCHDIIETTLHVLRDFPRAKYIWQKLVPTLNQSGFF